MEKIKLSLFDVFAYLVPGVPLVILLCEFLRLDPHFPLRMPELLQTMNLYGASAVILLAYVLGFSIQWVAYKCFKKLMQHFASEKYTKDRTTSLSHRAKEIERMRMQDPDAFDTLHSFMALRAMGYNLCFVLVVFALLHGALCLVRDCCCWPNDLLILASIGLAVLCFTRARAIHRMCQELITATTEVLNERGTT